jgi:hypothetical protein
MRGRMTPLDAEASRSRGDPLPSFSPFGIRGPARVGETDTLLSQPPSILRATSRASAIMFDDRGAQILPCQVLLGIQSSRASPPAIKQKMQRSHMRPSCQIYVDLSPVHGMIAISGYNSFSSGNCRKIDNFYKELLICTRVQSCE